MCQTLYSREDIPNRESISTVTLPSTLMGRLMPMWWMRKPRLRGVAGETWKVLGFRVVTLLLQWLWLVAPDLLRGKRRSI